MNLSEKKTTKGSRAAKPAGTGSPMDVTLLQQLVNLMSANDLNTVDIRDGDKRVILKRGAVQPVMMASAMHAMHAMQPMQASMAAPAARPAEPGSPAAVAAEDAGLVPIKSPMVGTFYAAPSPDAKPFVSVGSAVNEESDVCIIEAMKVFNNIKAEMRGTIAKILVQSGQPVEFGQAMFLVKPS